ncbi:MAG: hypothetical protein AAFU54_05465 [Chloroflexota bacterium]
MNDIRQLSPDEQFELVSEVLSNLRQQQTMPRKPKRSLYGIAAHTGKAPSADEIDDARRDVWQNFPREDI